MISEYRFSVPATLFFTVEAEDEGEAMLAAALFLDVAGEQELPADVDALVEAVDATDAVVKPASDDLSIESIFERAEDA